MKGEVNGFKTKKNIISYGGRIVRGKELTSLEVRSIIM
jgi:hypothetical protein